MNKNYESPQIEVIEIELEGVLCASEEKVEIKTYGLSGVTDDGRAW